jgi:hypothetical protein
MPDFIRDQRLREAPNSGLGQRIPEPLHDRVERLCDLVYEAGYERPTKARMIAALLLAAEANPERLAAALAAYDRATVGDALLEGESDRAVVSLPQRRPGPRSVARRS